MARYHNNTSVCDQLGLEHRLMRKITKLKLQYFGHVTQESARQMALTVSNLANK